jgi:hypothetical protein
MIQIPKDDVIATYDAAVAKGRTLKEAFDSVLTKVHGTLHAHHPAPGEHRNAPAAHHAANALERVGHVDAQRFRAVADAEMASVDAAHDALRKLGAPPIKIASLSGAAGPKADHAVFAPVCPVVHAHQAQHHQDLWAEAARIVADAGITEGGRS